MVSSFNVMIIVYWVFTNHIVCSLTVNIFFLSVFEKHTICIYASTIIINWRINLKNINFSLLFDWLEIANFPLNYLNVPLMRNTNFRKIILRHLQLGIYFFIINSPLPRATILIMLLRVFQEITSNFKRFIKRWTLLATSSVCIVFDTISFC